MGKLDREQLPAVYRSSDLFLFLSRLAHEGQGLTYLEAMASGIPVVASPSGGALEFLTRYPIARLAEACDGAHLADQILALDSHPEEAKRQAAEALKVVRERASFQSYPGDRRKGASRLGPADWVRAFQPNPVPALESS